MVIAIGSAVVALLSAVVAGVMGAWQRQRTSRLEHELAERRRQETSAELAEKVMQLYRDPLVESAYALQSRLFNIVKQNYFGKYLRCGDSAEERYARDYTIFVIAEYLCWVEILRRDLRFLDSGNVQRNRALLSQLDRIAHEFQTDGRHRSPFRVFRGRQRGIAELMMVPTETADGPRRECMGYAAFTRHLDGDATFKEWFAQLDRDVDRIADGGAEEKLRPTELQRRLIDLIDFLDPEKIRAPGNRAKLPAPSEVGSAAQAPSEAQVPAVPVPR